MNQGILLTGGDYGQPWPVAPSSVTNPSAAIGAASVALSATPNPPGVEPRYRAILYAAGAACWVVSGDPGATTAAAGKGLHLAIGDHREVALVRGQTLAVIQDSAAGTGTLWCILPAEA